MTTKRVAILRGHHPDNPGVTLPSGATENAFQRALSDKLWPALHRYGIATKVFERPVPTYTAGVLQGMIPEVNDWFPDVVISLHSNGGVAQATGAEALYWPVTPAQVDRPEVTASGKPRERELARLIARACASSIGIRNRGAKVQSNSWNGPKRWHATKLTKAGNPVQIPGGPALYVLRDIDAASAITESHFMSNKSDQAKALVALETGALPSALAAALAEWLGVALPAGAA